MIAAILLAAGRATRFGSQKLLAPLDGEPLVRNVARRLLDAPLDEVLVVVGSEGAEVRAALDGLPLRIVENPAFADGMSSSLHAGVRALAPGTDAALVVLGDQPGVTPSLVGALVTEWRRSGLPIVAPLYVRERGTPVLFAAAIFPELLGVEGDDGARSVVERDVGRVALVRFGRDTPVDVDTAEDLARLQRR
jgi:molybdenum cofactor cytidylyltransferase